MALLYVGDGSERFERAFADISAVWVALHTAGCPAGPVAEAHHSTVNFSYDLLE